MFAAMAVVATGILIAFLEGSPLWKKKQTKELIVFSSILMIGVFLYVGSILDFPIPNPSDIIGRLVEPISKPIVTWIKGGDS
jgi:hypothetical protein